MGFSSWAVVRPIGSFSIFLYMRLNQFGKRLARWIPSLTSLLKRLTKPSKPLNNLQNRFYQFGK